MDPAFEFFEESGEHDWNPLVDEPPAEQGVEAPQPPRTRMPLGGGSPAAPANPVGSSAQQVSDPPESMIDDWSPIPDEKQKTGGRDPQRQQAGGRPANAACPDQRKRKLSPAQQQPPRKSMRQQQQEETATTSPKLDKLSPKQGSGEAASPATPSPLFVVRRQAVPEKAQPLGPKAQSQRLSHPHPPDRIRSEPLFFTQPAPARPAFEEPALDRTPPPLPRRVVEPSVPVIFPKSQLPDLIRAGRYVASVGKDEVVAIPTPLAEKLFPHQLAGVQFAWRALFRKNGRQNDELPPRTYPTEECRGFNVANHGAVLAHHQGTGKTLLGLTLLSIYHLAVAQRDKVCAHTILVAPASVHSTWRAEWKKHLCGTDVELHIHDVDKSGFEKWKLEGGVLIVSPQRLLRVVRGFKSSTTAERQDEEQMLAAFGQDPDMIRPPQSSGAPLRKGDTLLMDFNHIILTLPSLVLLDEAQYVIQGANNTFYMLVKSFASRGKIALTGTGVMENRIGDVFNIMNLVAPDYITSEQFDEFRAKIVESGIQGEREGLGQSFVLQALLKPFISRRLCRSLRGELPPLDDIIVTVPLTPFQLLMYRLAATKFHTTTTSRGLFGVFAALSHIVNMHKTTPPAGIEGEMDDEDSLQLASLDDELIPFDSLEDYGMFETDPGEAAGLIAQAAADACAGEAQPAAMRVPPVAWHISLLTQIRKHIDKAKLAYEKYGYVPEASAAEDGNSMVWSRQCFYLEMLEHPERVNQALKRLEKDEEDLKHASTVLSRAAERFPELAPGFDPRNYPLSGGPTGDADAAAAAMTPSSMRAPSAGAPGSNGPPLSQAAKRALALKLEEKPFTPDVCSTAARLQQTLSSALPNSNPVLCAKCLCVANLLRGWYDDADQCFKERVLVFSVSTCILSGVKREVERIFEATGVRMRSELIDYQVSMPTRSTLVGKFEGGSLDVLFATMRTTGFGWNLQAASVVIILDAQWNPAITAQAVCRAHRVGQRRRVKVYRLVGRGTYEEMITHKSIKKEFLKRRVVDGMAERSVFKEGSLEGSRRMEEYIECKGLNRPLTPQQVSQSNALCNKDAHLAGLREKGLILSAAEHKSFFSRGSALSREEKQTLLESAAERKGLGYGIPRLLPFEDRDGENPFLLDPEEEELFEERRFSRDGLQRMAEKLEEEMPQAPQAHEMSLLPHVNLPQLDAANSLSQISRESSTMRDALADDTVHPLSLFVAQPRASLDAFHHEMALRLTQAQLFLARQEHQQQLQQLREQTLPSGGGSQQQRDSAATKRRPRPTPRRGSVSNSLSRQ